MTASNELAVQMYRGSDFDPTRRSIAKSSAGNRTSRQPPSGSVGVGCNVADRTMVECRRADRLGNRGQQVFEHRLANGLVLLAERMEHVRSAAINFSCRLCMRPRWASGYCIRPRRNDHTRPESRDSRELSLALDGLESIAMRASARSTCDLGLDLARNIPATPRHLRRYHPARICRPKS